MFYFVFFGYFILCFSAILFCLFRVLCFLPVLLSPVPRQHALHIRSAHGVRGMDLHGVKGLPLHQPVQQFDGIAALICKISQIMVEIQHLNLDAVFLRLPQLLGNGTHLLALHSRIWRSHIPRVPGGDHLTIFSCFTLLFINPGFSDML